jgi:putative PEP-CTERM system histidine kinase
MSMDLVSLGYAIAAAAHLLLLLYLLRVGAFRDGREPAMVCFLAAVAVTAAWAGVKAYDETVGLPRVPLVADLLDLLRYGLWYAFAWLLLRPGTERPRLTQSLTALVGTFLLAAALGAQLLGLAVRGAEALAERLQMAASLGLAVYGLMLLEQLFRNQAEETRWNAKPVCLALGCIFVYDLYVHAEAVMFGRFDDDALHVRGAIHALSTPLLFIASRRHRAWISKLRVSRNAAFYSATLLLVGAYLVFMASVGYYVRFFGGTWGRALQLALLFAAIMLLVVLVFSGSLRARLRVFLGKNFFSYRYDYRQEWLRFTAMLSTRSTPQEVGVLVVRGLADMLECPAGSLWTRGLSDDQFVQTAQWNSPRSSQHEPADSEFCRFMREKEWIIDIEEYRASPKRYGQLMIPRWLLVDSSAWVVVPLIVADVMIGFVLLGKPRTTVELNWEVRDLLKTASRQAAGYLSRMHATEALLEARKFDAFNRMSAFVVHDLKNIITQLSLMLKNAQRLGDNPEFREDMLLTVESSLEKMRQLMLQLREGERPAGVAAGVDLSKVLRGIVDMAKGRGREVDLTIVDSIATRGHEDRLARVLGHVVQNALDATPHSGRVWITLRKDAGRAELVVGDSGAGMTPEFIRTSLFRPFSSTKQSGMGIGSYESFLYIKELGGTIDVTSDVGKGTVMTILLPLFDARTRTDLQLNTPP